MAVSIWHVPIWDRAIAGLVNLRARRAKPPLTFASAKSRRTGDFMTTDNPLRAVDLNARAERESRIHLALLRGVVETLKSNPRWCRCSAWRSAPCFRNGWN